MFLIYSAFNSIFIENILFKRIHFSTLKSNFYILKVFFKFHKASIFFFQKQFLNQKLVHEITIKLTFKIYSKVFLYYWLSH